MDHYGVNIKEEYEADTDDEDDQKPSVVRSADMKKEEYSADKDDEEDTKLSDVAKMAMVQLERHKFDRKELGETLKGSIPYEHINFGDIDKLLARKLSDVFV